MTDNFLDLFQPDPPAKPKATPEPVAAPAPVVAVIPDEPDTSLFDGLLDDPEQPKPVSEPEYLAPEVVDVPETKAMEDLVPAPVATEEDEDPSQGLTPEPVEVFQPVIDTVVDEQEPVEEEDPGISHDVVLAAPMSLPVVLAVADDSSRQDIHEAHLEAVDSSLVPAIVPAPNPPRSRLPVFVGAGVGLLVIGTIAWWSLSSNKESTTPVADTRHVQPVAATPNPTPVVPSTEPVAPMPAAIVDDIMGTNTVKEAPIETPPPPPVPEPAVVPEPTPAPKPVATKPKATEKSAPKPQAKPAEKSWQDDALDQLENLEKRL
ncbi:hypothetical protein [Stenotrophomonas maltophilia]|uniref:hypothetical protein n=1 Tax=Stenotrophomonas maltophilia TaxID=40324 RepID=UPI0011B5BCD2|nr:hypothetical protein [Stenotrophomonas maltophilia]